MKLLVIIPCYNEAGSLTETVERLKTIISNVDFIIVNDGSADDTYNICVANNYPVINLPFNLGLSNAIQTGMRYAYENGYDMALQYDGDGQHKPEYINEMIEQMKKSFADIVIGSRYISQKSSSLRGLGGRLLKLAIKMQTKKTISDTTSGMRLYNRKMINEFANQMNYGPEPDTLAYLMRRGIRVDEVHVTMRERTAGKSYLHTLSAVSYMLRMFVSILVISWFRKSTERV